MATLVDDGVSAREGGALLLFRQMRGITGENAGIIECQSDSFRQRQGVALPEGATAELCLARLYRASRGGDRHAVSQEKGVSCNCSPPNIQRYMSRISGPLLDRIDIHLEVPAVDFNDLSGQPSGDSSATIRDRVNTARQTQLHRFRNRERLFCNAHMASRDIRTFCRIDGKGEELLRMAITKLGLSARAYDRILKVARTIADLESDVDIQATHIGEAIQYRSLDRNLWM